MKQNDKMIWEYIDGNINNEEKSKFETLLTGDKSTDQSYNSALLLNGVLDKALNPAISSDFIARMQKSIGDEFAIINKSIWSKKDTITTAGVFLISLMVILLVYGKNLALSLKNTTFEMDPTYMTATLVLIAGSILMLTDKLYERILMKKH